MSDFDKNMQEALDGDSGFDPDRARSAQAEVFQTYEKKLKRSERVMWLQLYLLLAVGAYAAGGFMVQATTTKGWVGYGLAVLLVIVIMIQKTILFGIEATQIVAMKEIKQLRLAVAGEPTPQDDAATKPLRGIRRWERIAWLCGLLAIAEIAGLVGICSNRQDDLWRLKSQGRIEAHSVLTLRRFPHGVPSFYGVMGPVEGAILQSATLNGQPVPFDNFKTQYTIQLPHKLSWQSDKVELVWSFPLSALQDGGTLRAPLRSNMPVHAYSLTLYVEDDSGYEGTDNAWKFNKAPEELKNETEARRTLKLFTQDGGDVPRDNFGTCGLPIIPRPGR